MFKPPMRTFNQNFDGEELLGSVLTSQAITEQPEQQFYCEIALPNSDGSASFELFGSSDRTYLIDIFTGETFLVEMNPIEFEERFLTVFKA